MVCLGQEQVDRLKELGCTVTGVTSESVVSILNWIVKDVSEGGFGGSVRKSYRRFMLNMQHLLNQDYSV